MTQSYFGITRILKFARMSSSKSSAMVRAKVRGFGASEKLDALNLVGWTVDDPNGVELITKEIQFYFDTP